jgi:hypothetical protein
VLRERDRRAFIEALLDKAGMTCHPAWGRRPGPDSNRRDHECQTCARRHNRAKMPCRTSGSARDCPVRARISAPSADMSARMGGRRAVTGTRKSLNSGRFSMARPGLEPGTPRFQSLPRSGA